MPILSVRNVNKQFAPSRLWWRRAQPEAVTRALNDVSFEVYAGEMVGLLGPNGAGKTTLLKTISTLLYPKSGQVLLDGIDVYSQPELVHGRLGLVTCDERSFYWRLSGRMNLEFFSSLYRMDKAAARERINQLLEADAGSGIRRRPAVPWLFVGNETKARHRARIAHESADGSVRRTNAKSGPVKRKPHSRMDQSEPSK